MTFEKRHRRTRVAAALSGFTLTVIGLTSCGGGGNPLGNPADVNNPLGVGGQKLSFTYFQKCINPIFIAQLQINVNGVVSTNTCAGSGCHESVNGPGGAFRVVPTATAVDLLNPANTPDVVRLTDIYKNFYSAQGEVVKGSLTQSLLLAKPRLLSVLHGGGLIFPNDQDDNVKLISYWITHPVPVGQDEFSASASSMFTPADPITGTCNKQ